MCSVIKATYNNLTADTNKYWMEGAFSDLELDKHSNFQHVYSAEVLTRAVRQEKLIPGTQLEDRMCCYYCLHVMFDIALHGKPQRLHLETTILQLDVWLEASNSVKLHNTESALNAICCLWWVHPTMLAVAWPASVAGGSCPGLAQHFHYSHPAGGWLQSDILSVTSKCPWFGRDASKRMTPSLMAARALETFSTDSSQPGHLFHSLFLCPLWPQMIVFLREWLEASWARLLLCSDHLPDNLHCEGHTDLQLFPYFSKRSLMPLMDRAAWWGSLER